MHIRYGNGFLFLFFLIFSGFVYSQDLQSAINAYKSGRYQEASVLFENVLKNGNGNKDAYMAAVDCYLRLKNFTKAIYWLEKSLARFGNDFSAEYALSQLYTQTGNYSKSLDALLALLKKYPDSSAVLKNDISDVFVLLGNSQFNKENFNGSIENFKQALIYNNKNIDAKKNLAITFIRLKRYSEALPYAEDTYKVLPDDKITRQMYFEVLIGLELFEKALVVAKKLADDEPDDIKIQLNLAMLHRYNQNAEDAYLVYESLRMKFPENKDVVTAETDLLLLIGESDKVINIYRDFLTLRPYDEEINLALGGIYENKKMYDSALSVYRFMQVNNIGEEGGLNIAKVFITMGKKDTAITVLKEYIKKVPRRPEAFYLITELLKEKKSYQEVQNYLIDGITLFPTEVLLSIDLAKLLINRNNPDSALIVLDNIRGVHNEYPEINYLFGTIFRDRNDSAKAQFYFIRTIKYGLKRSEILQMGLLQQTSTLINNSSNQDSAQQTANQLDTLRMFLKASFDSLRELVNDEKYLQILDDLIKDVPSGAVLYLYKAKYLNEIGNFDEAEKNIDYSLRLAYSSEEVQREAGIFFEARGNFEKALEAFRAAFTLNNKEPFYCSKIIDNAMRVGRLNEICDYWKALYLADKRKTVLREFLIEALHKSGRTEEAQAIINEIK